MIKVIKERKIFGVRYSLYGLLFISVNEHVVKLRKTRTNDINTENFNGYINLLDRVK